LSLMHHFYLTTLFFVFSTLAIGFCTTGPAQWAVMAVWLFLYVALVALGVSVLRLNFFVRAICRGEPGRKHVALTFDDGPDPAVTPKLLDVLDRNRIQAGFFVVGSKAAAHPDLVREIDRRGHVLGNHSYRHAWWTNFLLSGRLAREIRRTQEVIRAVTGKTPAFYRPPMGLTNPHLSWAVRQAGLTVIGWEVRPFDTQKDADTVIRRVLNKVRDGSIILLHDGGRNAAHIAHVVEELAKTLPEHGFSFTSLETITGLDAYQSGAEKEKRGAFRLRSAWRASLQHGNAPRLLHFVALLIADTTYAKKALAEKTDLVAFQSRPSGPFLTGIGLVLFSYVLGWPMVGLFGFLAAWFKEPFLFLGGPVCYAISHLVWLLGMLLAGRDSIRYVDVFFRWGTRRAVERVLGETHPCQPRRVPGPDPSSGKDDKRRSL